MIASFCITALAVVLILMACVCLCQKRHNNRASIEPGCTELTTLCWKWRLTLFRKLNVTAEEIVQSVEANSVTLGTGGFGKVYLVIDRKSVV